MRANQHRPLALGVMAGLLAVAVVAGPSTAMTLPTRSAVDARLASSLPARMASPLLGGGPGAVLAVDVVNARTGAVIFSRRGTTPARPASTMKIVTATVAFTTMGPTRRLPTPVLLSGVSGHTAHLTLVGAGDPLLTSAELRDLARATSAAVRARGITSVRVAVDDQLFAPPSPAPGWTAGYDLGVVRPVRALVRDGRRVDDSSLDAGRYFAAQLAAVSGHPAVTFIGRDRAARGAVKVASTRGHTVEEAARRMLQVSDNDVAEMLFRLSAHATHRPTTWSGGTRAARATLLALGVPLNDLVLNDGSGLSRTDRLTPRALVTVLQRDLNVTRYPRLRPIVVGRDLPVAGESGSLAGRYLTAPSSCARGLVVAKTGALSDVLSLSGIATGVDGVPRAFAILLQNPPVEQHSRQSIRVAIDGLAATITGCW